MSAWPSFMPDGQLASWGYSRKDAVLRTELDTGKIRARRVYDDAPASANIEWVLTGGQMGYFEYWYKNTVNLGADEFTMTINVGSGCNEHTCRFLGSYDVSLIRPDLFRVSAPLYIKQIYLLDANTIAIMEEYGDPDAYYAFIDIFDIYVNQDLPNSEMGA